MKATLLQFLACPECQGDSLSLDVFSREDQEIVEGSLSCGECGRHYPIIDGVPRLLPDGLIGSVRHYHPGFFARHDVPLASHPANDAVTRTLTFYSYARAKLFIPEPSPEMMEYWQQSLRMRIPGIAELSGRVGVDAGCGEGRYTYCLARLGAEVIGLDLSEAVNLAYRRNRANPRAHVVQGSIYQPPFQRGSLDFVLSTGVLHHLPAPRQGFDALVPLLRANGSIHIWVYGLRQMSRIYQFSHLTFLRQFAGLLSPRASYLLSVPLAVALNVLLLKPVHLLAQSAYGRQRINRQLRELASLPLQMHIAEVQDRIGVPVTHFLTSEELRDWYERAGLAQVSITATDGGRGWSARGTATRSQHVLA